MRPEQGYCVIETYGKQIENVVTFVGEDAFKTARDYWWNEKIKPYFKHVNRQFLIDTVERADQLLARLDADDCAGFMGIWQHIHDQIHTGEHEEFFIKTCEVFPEAILSEREG